MQLMSKQDHHTSDYQLWLALGKKPGPYLTNWWRCSSCFAADERCRSCTNKYASWKRGSNDCL